MAVERTAAAPRGGVRGHGGPGRAVLRGGRRGHRADPHLLRPGQVLMRGAVAVDVQRHPLARCAAAGRGAALQRVAVGVEAGARQALEHLLRRRHVAVDDVPHARPVADVEVRAHVAEERARGPSEVVLVGDQALDGRLACAKDGLVLLSTPDDVPRDLAVDRPAYLIHEPLSFSFERWLPTPRGAEYGDAL